jgi:hypothetical protein
VEPQPETLEQALAAADTLVGAATAAEAAAKTGGPDPPTTAVLSPFQAQISGAQVGVQTSEPTEPATTSEIADQKLFPTVEVPIGELSLSADVPNFKADADEQTGVVQGQQLEGKYERLGTGAVTVWEREGGRKEVISGRHRFDLARRSGERTIPAQVVREREGFTKEMAMTLDAEMNIRDGQGTVSDYANYFRNTTVTEEDARARGLLSRAKGKAGWALGKNAGTDLYALYRAGKVKEDQAIAIATAAPAEEALQRVGSKAAMRGAGPQELSNFIQAVRYKTKNAPPEQLDLFGSNDAAMNEAERLAKVATQLQRELDKEIRATDNAVRNADRAREKGIRFERDPQEILGENAMLRVQRGMWDNWALHPELVAQVTGQPVEQVAQAAAEPGPGPVAQAMASVEAALDNLKVDMQGKQLHLFGLAPAVWNTLVDMVKLGVRGGRKLAAAIDWAIAQIRAQGHAFDEDKARQYLLNENVRQFSEKVLDPASEVSPAVQEALPESAVFYEPRTNESDAAAANRMIDTAGVDNAIAAFKDATVNMPGAVRTALGLALIKRLGQEERLAKSAIDRDAAVAKQVDLVEHVTGRATEIAQSLQAMSMWARMTPAGHLRMARRVFNQAAERALGRMRPALEEIRGVLGEVNAATSAAATKEPEVIRAVDQVAGPAVANALHNQIVIEVSGALGSSPAVMQLIREQTRKSISAQRLREVASQLQTILARHYQDPEGKTLASKIVAGVGLENETAETLARKIDKEFERAMTKRTEDVQAKVRRVRSTNNLGLLSADNEVDRAIRTELKRLDLRLDALVKWHYTRADATGQGLAKRLSDGLGLSEDGAAFLAARIEGRFKQLATERKRKALEKLTTPAAAREVKRPAVTERLIQLSNLGAFSEQQFYDAVKEKLGLPVFTPEIAKEITRRANAIQKLPEGFQQQRAQIDLMNYIERQKGVRWQDLPLAFWFANVLSGPTTHLVNVISNTLNLAAHTGIEVMKRPTATPQILEALGRGAGKGVLEAAAVLSSGQATGTRLQKIEAARPLELAEFKGWKGVFKLWRYVYRALAAEDMLFFKAAEEMKSAVAARVIAKKEGVRGAQLSRRVAEIMGETVRDRAEAQATAEGLAGLDYRRRVNEIMEQGRPDALRETAKDYALRVTFNQEPSGVLGAIASGVHKAAARAPFLKVVVPFVNIVANVANESLNYLPPVGFGRALYGTWFGKLDGKPIADKDQLYDQYAKATAGLLALAGVAALAAKYRDDDDPPFDINGAGPRTADQRKQLMERGWLPYSFKIGSRYYSYANTPLAVPMAILGNYMDALKYKHLGETDALNRVAYATLLSGRVITEQSFLNSIADLFEMLGRDSTKGSADAGGRMFTRMASGFVVPNLFRQIDQLNDPTLYDSTGIQAKLVNQVPWVRRLNEPALNALGEPVQKYLSSRFTSAERPDELWRVLTEKQAWVPVVDRETIVGDRKRGADYFRVLEPDEIYELTRESGQAIRDRLEANIDRIELMEPEQARAYVQRVTQEEREKVKRAMR